MAEFIQTAKRTARKLLPFVLIILISVSLSLLLAEKMIRYANPQFTYQQAKLVSLKAYDKSDYLPFTMMKNTETVHFGNTHEFAYTIKTNSQGYRMEEFPQEKPAGEYRILMLGDSLTFGFGVEVDQSFLSRLEEKLNLYLEKNNIKDKKIQIINAGFVDGKSPDSYYLYLKEEGLKLNPDLIIVNYFINNDVMDIDDNVWEKVDQDGLPTKISARTSYIDPPFYRLKKEYQNWKLVVPILRDSHLWVLFATAWETKSPETVNAIKKILGTKPLPLIESGENDDCLFRQKCSGKMDDLLGKFYKMTDGIVELSKANNIPLIFSFIPANPQVREHALVVDAEKRYPKLTTAQISAMLTQVQPQKDWEERFTKMDVFVVDPLPYVTDSGWQSFYFTQDGHPTVPGNEAISQAFFDSLTNDWQILAKIRK